MNSAAGTVIFDLDGTLTDSRPGILRTTRYALRRLNEAMGRTAPIPEESALEFMVGPPLRETFAKLVGPDLVERLLGFYRERYAEAGLFENAVYEGVPQALEALRRDGRRLFVATSKYEADARRILDHFGLAGFFAGIYGSQNDGGRAVKDELLGFLAAREGILAGAGDAVMIGDRKYDALGARAVGLPAIGALWGYGAAEELRDAGADPLIETPGEIFEAVEATLRRAAVG
ncbi:MAG: HAD hydrolase-like protein [Roseiarcus sp.]